MKNCPQCSKENPDEAKFCLSCGTKLDSKIVCTNCSTKNPQDAVFCMNCGSKLSKINESGQLPDNRKKSQDVPQENENEESLSLETLLEMIKDAEVGKDFLTALASINKAIKISPDQADLRVIKARILAQKIYHTALSQNVFVWDVDVLEEIKSNVKKSIALGLQDQTLLDQSVEVIAHNVRDYFSLLLEIKKKRLSTGTSKRMIEYGFSKNELPVIFEFIRFLWESNKTKPVAIEIKDILEFIVDFYNKYLIEQPYSFDTKIIKDSLGDITKDIRLHYPTLQKDQQDVSKQPVDKSDENPLLGQMKFDSENEDYVSVNCQNCNELKKIKRERCVTEGDKYMIVPPVTCTCGVIANTIDGIPQPPSPTKEQEQIEKHSEVTNNIDSISKLEKESDKANPTPPAVTPPQPKVSVEGKTEDSPVSYFHRIKTFLLNYKVKFIPLWLILLGVLGIVLIILISALGKLNEPTIQENQTAMAETGQLPSINTITPTATFKATSINKPTATKTFTPSPTKTLNPSEAQEALDAKILSKVSSGLYQIDENLVVRNINCNESVLSIDLTLLAGLGLYESSNDPLVLLSMSPYIVSAMESSSDLKTLEMRIYYPSYSELYKSIKVTREEYEQIGKDAFESAHESYDIQAEIDLIMQFPEASPKQEDAIVKVVSNQYTFEGTTIKTYLASLERTASWEIEVCPEDICLKSNSYLVQINYYLGSFDKRAIWYVNGNSVFTINGASKSLTPNLSEAINMGAITSVARAISFME